MILQRKESVLVFREAGKYHQANSKSKESPASRDPFNLMKAAAWSFLINEKSISG